MDATGQRAVIYARYSTDQQSDRSIEDQIALCTDHARERGLIVTRTYEDRAKSSASLIGRDGIIALMADAARGEFDCVVVEAFDRLSRDQGDLAGIHKRLQFQGIQLRAVHDGQADIMKIGLQGLMGALYLQQLKEKTHRGLAGRVRTGQSAGGLSYGYRPVPGQPGALVIDDAEAAVVRRIYDAYGAGQTPRDIAIALNTDHISPPRGAQWNGSTIAGHRERGYGILHNALYRGERVWNRVRMVRDPETGKRVNRTNPRSAWIREPAPDLAIVSQAQWDAVQAELDRRSTGPRGRAAARRPRRPLSGLFRCGVCGGGMSIKKTKGDRVWLTCSRASNLDQCTHTQQPRLDLIEQQVFAALVAALDHPDSINAYLTAYREEQLRLNADRRQQRTRLERAAARAATAYDRAVDLYLRGAIDGDDAATRIETLKREKEAAAAALATDAPDLPKIELHPATARRHIAALTDLSATLAAGRTGAAETLQLVRNMITAIDVTPGTSGGHDVTVYGSLAELVAPCNEGGESMVAWGGLARLPLAQFSIRRRA